MPTAQHVANAWTADMLEAVMREVARALRGQRHLPIVLTIRAPVDMPPRRRAKWVRLHGRAVCDIATALGLGRGCVVVIGSTTNDPAGAWSVSK